MSKPDTSIKKAIADRFAEHPDVSKAAGKAFVDMTWPTVNELKTEGNVRRFLFEPASHGAEATCSLGADQRIEAHLPGGTEHALCPVQACTVAVSLVASAPLAAIMGAETGIQGIVWRGAVPRGEKLIVSIEPIDGERGHDVWRLNVTLEDGTVIFKNNRVWTKKVPT